MGSAETSNIFRTSALFTIIIGIALYVFSNWYSGIDGWVKINRRHLSLKVAEMEIDTTREYLHYDILLQTKDTSLFAADEGGQSSILSSSISSLKDLEGKTLSCAGYSSTGSSSGYHLRAVIHKVQGKKVTLGFSGSFMAYDVPGQRRSKLGTPMSFNGEVTISRVTFFD